MLSSGQIETLEQATAVYHGQLRVNDTNPIARLGCEYLASRAFDFDAIERFRFGCVVVPIPGDEEFKGRIAIPTLTPAGVRGIKYRCIEPHDCKTSGGPYHNKYAQPVGQEQRPYNVAAYHSGRDVLGVAEGEFDAASATIHLDLPTLGIPGAQQWAKHGKYWKIALQDFGLVIIFVDGDKPKCMCTPRHAQDCPSPKRAGLELAKQIQADAGNARLVRLPEGEDVNSMVVAGRVDELKRKAGID